MEIFRPPCQSTVSSSRATSLLNLPHQLLNLVRFGSDEIHTSIQSSRPMLTASIRRHGDDGYPGATSPRSLKGSDSLGAFVTIHFWHLNIHEYHVVLRTADGFPGDRKRVWVGNLETYMELFQRFLAVQGYTDLVASFSQLVRQDFLVDGVIFDDSVEWLVDQN
jgi:hypothetical protein